MARWQRVLATTSHFLLYVLMIAVPVSGWIVNSAANVPFDLYGLIPVPDLVPATMDEAAIEALAKSAHDYRFLAICALFGLHVLGALEHHWVDGDAVLERMLPFSRASDPIRGE